MKLSILDQFAADAINAPAAVTGGSGKCGKKSSKKSKKSSKKSKKSSKKSHSHSHSKSGSKGGCGCPPPPKC